VPIHGDAGDLIDTQLACAKRRHRNRRRNQCVDGLE
jgi:hypothetical protein